MSNELIPDPVVHRRTAEDYGEAFGKLLPEGEAWPRDLNSTLMRLVYGMAALWGVSVDPRLADLLERESDPRATLEMLDDWERNFGLPDPCIDVPQGIGARHDALIHRMTMEGGQSIPFFVAVAAELGYDITIGEYSPFMAGISRCGDTRNLVDGEHYRWLIGPETIRYYWTIRPGTRSLHWWRCGEAVCGVDPFCRIGLATDLECILRRYKPAHTEIIFDYSDIVV